MYEYTIRWGKNGETRYGCPYLFRAREKALKDAYQYLDKHPDINTEGNAVIDITIVKV